tara:strand:- start:2285 stop:3721 length:1437 start_codon:yes stop_codon:yes gene_type:complete
MWNYYIDKQKYNKDDNYVDIKLDYPIEISNYDYLKVKLCNFKYFNNDYNISQKLQNNIITLRKTPYNYTQIFNYENLQSFGLISEFFDNIDLQALKTGVTETIDFDTRVRTITGANYVLYFKDYYVETITIGFNNIFTGYVSQRIDFMKQISYLILETKDDTQLKVLRKVKYAFRQEISSSPSVEQYELIVEGSQDGITYTQIPTINPYITFQPKPSNIDYVIETNDNVILENTTPYKYYKFTIDFFSTYNPYDYKLNKLQLFYAEVVQTLDYTESSPINTNLIVEDGFYNSTNIVTKLTELLEPHQIVPTIEDTTNKMIFLNNTTYIYNPINSTTDPNGKLELLFNTKNIQDNYGIKGDVLELTRNINIYTDTNINLINFSKIVISTDLNMTNKTHNELINGNSESTGIGNILAWIDCDQAPFTCINYRNYENNDYKIQNKIINNIRLNFYNEKSQPLNIDNALIHLQIKKVNSKYN